MDIPARQIALSSIVGSVLVLNLAPQYALWRSHVATLCALFGLQVLAWAVWLNQLRPRFFSPLRHLPQPTGNKFFMGQWHRMIGEPNGAPLQEWLNTIPNDGLIRYLSLFNDERVILTSPKALSEVLTQKSYEFIKPPAFVQGLERLLGTGILLAEGDVHRTQRKNLMPAFAFRHVKDLYPVFWSKSCEMIEAMTVKVQQDGKKMAEPDEALSAEMAFQPWASRATLDIIGVAGCDQDFGAIQDPDAELAKTYRTVTHPTRAAQMLGMLNIILPSWFVSRLPVKRNGEIEAAALVIRETCRKMVELKKAKLEKNEASGVDILSVALQSGGFTDENLVDQMMTFLAAGHDTTSSALTWAVCLLCQHPNVQTRLREEIRAKLSSPKARTSTSSPPIDKLPYLSAVMSETLRVFPPVLFTMRQVANHGTTILGQPIPKGTRVIIAPKAVNTSLALWGSDALDFNPDRWIDRIDGRANHMGGSDSNYSFLTFLHGPRSCIGQSFARAEFACLLAAVVGRFDFEFADPNYHVEVKSGITARPADGLMVRLKLLEDW
ncbi:MAG: hypothetical protein M1817_003122 [Caeruleum heppii]|nr:MAG: hypothetical protein M1817_003122 [Caeruleum heppii]